MRNTTYTTLLLIAMLCGQALSAQDRDSLPCQEKDITDYIRKWFKMKPKKEKNASVFIAPVFGSTPSTGFVYGLTFQGAFQLPESKMSMFQSNIQYTTKKQLTVSLKNNIYAKGNKFFLSGDWIFSDYSQPTYGLGSNAPIGTWPYYFHYNDVGEPTDSLVQPMRYLNYKIHQTMSFNVGKDLYIGPGVHLDVYNNIEDLKLDTPITSPTSNLTSHYIYSRKYDFDPGKYMILGISLNVVYDSRDNMINAYKGIYANVNVRVNPVFLGSDQMSSTLWTEFRTYLGVSKRRPNTLFAFWYVGHFTMAGDLPYLNLPALGNDQRQKTGRGYTIGRFRGNDMVYGEVEFRFPISRCTNTLGAVLFLNGTTASNKDNKVELFEYIQPGYGAGLRVLFTKKSRMNIQVDYGVGRKSGGIYFGASEAF